MFCLYSFDYLKKNKFYHNKNKLNNGNSSL